MEIKRFGTKQRMSAVNEHNGVLYFAAFDCFSTLDFSNFDAINSVWENWIYAGKACAKNMCRRRDGNPPAGITITATKE